MINEQIILWIAKNREIYFRNAKEWKNGDRDASLSQQQIINKLYEINEELKRRIPIVLKARKQATIINFITFFIPNQSKPNQSQVCYCLNDKFKMIITQHDSKKIKAESKQSDIFNKQVASALMIDRQYAETLLSTFSKAIYDLITNGHNLSLNFDLCRIKISKNECKCTFSQSLLRNIKAKDIQPQRQNYKLYLCPTLKCSNKDTYNVTESIRQGQQAKWKQIKHGNVYSRPSLQQIKNLYDRGSALQVKYKQYFEK